MILNCVTIDDEPLAREGISNYIREIDFLRMVGSGNNPVELIQLLDQESIDLVFLDIQMPIMNGIDFLKMAQNPPMIIITTAYPSYALEGFQLDVLDYLLKPITFNRFFKAVNKAKNYAQLQLASSTESSNGSESEDYFFIKCENKYEKLFFADILYIQAMQNYVIIHTTKGKYITLLYLKNVEQYLEGQAFMRVHKSYIVAVPKIEAIDNNELLIQSHRIPISRNYKDRVLKQIIDDKLWKK
ncbi:MAG: LytTR family DNA-binding domain-containing protein [Saprospiraceae bacterium]|nr:LytTR family DNA-binding domain-containing protein [Saprospiraceae bacterium]